MDVLSAKTRRQFFASAGIALAVPLVAAPALGRGRSDTVAETASGKLRGVRSGTTLSFKGIPYAADTGGPNRFMAPRPVESWAGIRDATRFGDRSAQETGGIEAQTSPTDWFSWYSRPGTYSENCCVLNVWTRDLDRSARRPVMLYIHGGGFRSGAGDGPALDGNNLARLGDVVVVTVNHRLNALGYLSLGHLDADFADAGNAGQLDLIAALKWVRENIEAFGGDPGRVLLFGQSGGGSKIATLMIMPGAQGLLHRAVNMSGPTGYGIGSAEARVPVADLILRDLNLGKGDLRRLQSVPAAQLREAHRKAVAALGVDDFRPVIDGRHIPHGAMTAEAIALHGSVPMLMGTTETELTFWLGRDKRNLTVTPAQVTDRIARQFGMEAAMAGGVYQAYRDAVPGRIPYDVLAALTTDLIFRARMLPGAEAKAAARKAPVWLYNFGWQIPVDQGIWKSPHTVDIPFAFANTANAPSMIGNDKSAPRVSHALMSAFVAFARAGNPANRAMPAWPAYELGRKATMVVNRRSKVFDGYLDAERRVADTLLDQPVYKIQAGPLMRFTA